MTPAQFDVVAQEVGRRARVAMNPSLPAAWVARFRLDPGLRKWLALNPALAPEVQLALAADEDAGVRETLRQNPSLTAEARAVLDARQGTEP